MVAPNKMAAGASIGCVVVGVLAVLAFIGPRAVHGRVIDFEAQGAVAGDDSLSTAERNTHTLNATLAALKPGDEFRISNKTFHLQGGVYAADVVDVVFALDGTLAFSEDRKHWPTDSNGRVFECIMFERFRNVTFTSSGTGTLDGRGESWWGAIKYMINGENRPRLFHMRNSSQLVFEHWLLKDSPYWTFWLNDAMDVEIRFCDVHVARDKQRKHDWKDIQAFNTDGFDVTGTNIYIHDCNIWNDDDCIAVKEQPSDAQFSKCSQNMVFERINASGLGLTIGSVGNGCVSNITFRDCYMSETVKGIYVKSRPTSKQTFIKNVLYEDIRIDNPSQYSVWIGPQQAIYDGACSLLWPEHGDCPVPAEVSFINITLRNVLIQNPKMSPGVVLGNKTNPMTVTFDNVVVTHPGSKPFGDKYYYCDGVDGKALHNTTPVPPCFGN